MKKEVFILLSVWILTIIMLVKFLPRGRSREAAVIFLFKQSITWLFGLVVSQLKLIEYPVREFPYASKASFTFEFFVYPAICVIFNLHYPEGKSFLKRLLHFVYYCSVMTFIEAVLEKTTETITYFHWAWYATWITLFLTFFASRQFYRWFFKLAKKGGS